MKKNRSGSKSQGEEKGLGKCKERDQKTKTPERDAAQKEWPV
jgi:hypothetical protein